MSNQPKNQTQTQQEPASSNVTVDLTALLQQMVALQQQVTALQASHLQSAQAQQAYDAKREAEFEQLKQFLSKPSDERSQIEADRRFQDGPRSFKVKIGWMPELVIRAVDQTHAFGRYQDLCGIRSISDTDRNPKQCVEIPATALAAN